MLLNAPGEPGASWHSHAHDAISGLVYVNLVAAQLALAWRFGRDPAWRHWRPWLLASAAATGVILIAYATDVTGPAAAILQRAAVSLPQAAVAAIAARLMWRNTQLPADIDAAIGRIAHACPSTQHVDDRTALAALSALGREMPVSAWFMRS